MNFRFFILIFLLAGFVYAQSANYSCPADNKKAKEHRGMFKVFEVGNSVEAINLKIIDTHNSEKDDYDSYKEEFIAAGVALNIKYGVTIANLLAFYSSFNIDPLYGKINQEKFSDERTTEEYYSLHVQTILGIGTAVYPFQSFGFMNGFFIGGTASYVVSIMTEGHMPFSQGKAFQVEIGKDWWTDKHSSVGVAFSFTDVIFYTGQNRYGIDIDNHNYSIALMVRFVKG